MCCVDRLNPPPTSVIRNRSHLPTNSTLRPPILLLRLRMHEKLAARRLPHVALSVLVGGNRLPAAPRGVRLFHHAQHQFTTGAVVPSLVVHVEPPEVGSEYPSHSTWRLLTPSFSTA